MKAPQLPEVTQSRAGAQLLSMKAQYDRATEKNADISRYLAWLPDDHPLPTAEPLGDLLFRLTQLMREAEHLHGMHGQEPAPWLLMCRDIDLLNTDDSAELPTGYDKVVLARCTGALAMAVVLARCTGALAMARPRPPRLHLRGPLRLLVCAATPFSSSQQWLLSGS
jgi:hypothetical protein